MDEYQLELRQLRQRLVQLRAGGAEPDLIEEYEAEVRNLSALYRAATETLEAGERDDRLGKALEELGFGEWTLDNVYSFVYDVSMELPVNGQELALLIETTDYAGSLLEALEG